MRSFFFVYYRWYSVSIVSVMCLSNLNKAKQKSMGSFFFLRGRRTRIHVFGFEKSKILGMWVFFLVFQVLCQTGETSRFPQTAAGSLS